MYFKGDEVIATPGIAGGLHRTYGAVSKLEQGHYLVLDIHLAHWCPRATLGVSKRISAGRLKWSLSDDVVGDCGHLGYFAGQVASHVQNVSQDVSNCTGASNVFLEPPGEWRVWIRGPVLKVGGPEIDNSTYRTLIYIALCKRNSWCAAVVESHHVDSAGLACCLVHGFSLLDGFGQWLFADNVLARP